MFKHKVTQQGAEVGGGAKCDVYSCVVFVMLLCVGC